MLIKNITSNRNTFDQDGFAMDLADPKQEFIHRYLESDKKKALYIHTPFCASKCRYCKWKSSKLNNHEELRVHYEEVLTRQLEEYKEIFDNVIFDELYLGGGTPTIVSPKMMSEFFGKIPHFIDIKNKCMEASPDTLTNVHVDIFQKYKFRFLSLGIQTLDPAVLERENRPFISKQQVVNICDYLNARDIYFNLDMICFLDKGDVRDLPAFERELDFLMKECKPSAITIHQEHFHMQSFEKTLELIRLLRRKVEEYPGWICNNSDLNDEDAPMDAMYRAEYKLVSRDYSYMHHLWDKYSLNLKEDYCVLAIGSTPKHRLFSFTDNYFYKPEENQLFLNPHKNFEDSMFNLLRDIRIHKGLQEE